MNVQEQLGDILSTRTRDHIAQHRYHVLPVSTPPPLALSFTSSDSRPSGP